MMNAGEYKHRISIYAVKEEEDNAGFKNKPHKIPVLNTFAKVKTTKGYTLIQSNTDFEKAYTNFTIRFPKTEITRDMIIEYRGKTYSIEYLNNIDEKDVELEIQARVVCK